MKHVDRLAPNVPTKDAFRGRLIIANYDAALGTVGALRRPQRAIRRKMGGCHALESTFIAAAVFISAFAFAAGYGCSVYMATHQPPKKDVSVFTIGTPRSLVIAELGQPSTTQKRDGKNVDFFAFTQGYSTGVKAGRAVFHGVADVFTIGMWEAVATPGEAVFSGTNVKVEVAYDENDRVSSVTVFEGGSELNAPNVAPGLPTSGPNAAAKPLSNTVESTSGS